MRGKAGCAYIMGKQPLICAPCETWGDLPTRGAIVAKPLFPTPKR